MVYLNSAMKSYIIAVVILIASVSYLIFYSKFENCFEPSNINALVGKTDGSRVLITGTVGKLTDNGFYLCEYESCIKATGDYSGIVYSGDRVVVYGTVDSYKGNKFLRINRLTVLD